jgi:hypothetical protein
LIAYHPLWHVCGTALFVLLTVIHRRTRSSGVFVVVLWNLTGVLLHELAHLLAGLVFRARPAGMSLVPHRDGTGWRLGSVRFRRITAVNAVPVALAPLGLAGLAFWIARHWFSWYKPSLVATLALYASIFILLYNALPSGRDLRVAFNWRSILLYSPLLVALACYFIWPWLR